MRQLPRDLIVRTTGVLFLLAALWFLTRTVSTNWDSLGQWRPTPELGMALMALATAFGLGIYLQAEVWHRVVSLYGAEPRQRTYPSLTATIFARYVPGNVAHLLGRAAWLHGGALSKSSLLRATLVELCVTPTGALLALTLFLPIIALGAPPIVVMAALGAPATLLVLWLGLSTVRPEGAGGVEWTKRLSWTLVCATLFMVIFGCVFAVIGIMLGLTGFETLFSAAILAWLIGYIAPGIPGGLGVREAVLIALLSGVGAPDTVILASVLLRLVTTGGELVCFLSGFAVVRWMRAHPNARA